MPLVDGFKETIKACEKEGKERGDKPLFSIEEGAGLSEEINAEMREYNRNFKRKWTPPTDMLILYPCYA